MFRTPLHGFRAQHTRNPHLWMRLLVGQRPGIHVAIMKMFAFVAPRSGLGPGLNDKVMRFVKVLTVVGGIGVIEKLLTAGTTYPTSDQTPTRDQVNLGQF